MKYNENRNKNLWKEGLNVKDSFKKVLPACFGSSVAVSAVQLFHHTGVWGVGDFFGTFVVTTIIVSFIFWIFSFI